MDHILTETRMEDRLIVERINSLDLNEQSAKRQQYYWRSTRLVLRYSILRALTQESFRELSSRAADSQILLTHARKKPDSKNARKAVFWQMKKQVQVIERHGQRYLELLENRWEQTA